MDPHTSKYKPQILISTKPDEKLRAMPKTDKLASLESMSSRIGKMFEEGCFSDLVTNIGQTKKSLHKNVLSYRSEFFRAMFEHNFTESSNPVVNIEVDEGSTAEATVCVVEHLYTGWIDLTPETVGEIMAAADKLQVSGLFFLLYVATCW